MDFGLIANLTFLITFQLLLVGLFLITNKKGNRRNNALLGAIFIMIAWNMGDLTLRMNGVVLGWGFVQLLDDAFILAFGPVFFLYAQGVMYRDFKLSLKQLLHFIPYLLLTTALVLNQEMAPSQADEIVRGDLAWPYYLVNALIYIHFFIYLVLSYQSLLNYRNVIRNTYSQIDQINLDWLSSALKTFLAVAVISLVHSFIPLFGNQYVLVVTLVLLLLFILYFVLNIILKALRQPEIFTGISQSESKYQGSTLTPEQNEQYQQTLMDYFQREKPYLNPDLKISDVSEKLFVSTKILSQVINQSFQKSFFDFVNGYRIGEACQIMRESNDAN